MAIGRGGQDSRALNPRILLISSWKRCTRPDEETEEAEPPLLLEDVRVKSGHLPTRCEPANQQLLEILLPHPSQPSIVVAFLWANSTLYELNQFTRDMGLTSVLLRSPEFVLGNGSLLAATPFDPLFIFLALLHRHAAEFFVPFSQLISQCEYSHEVRRNLAWLASAPAVTQRISLVADVRCADSSTVDGPTLGGEAVSTSLGVQPIPEFCRLNVDKALAFLHRKHAKMLNTILRLRLPFKDCVILGESSQYNPPPKGSDSGSASTDTRTRTRPLPANGRLNPHRDTVSPNDVTDKCEIDISAASRLAEEILSGYLPKGLATALKQQCDRRRTSRTTKTGGSRSEISCTRANAADDSKLQDGTTSICGSGRLFPGTEVLSGRRPAFSDASAGREKSLGGLLDGSAGGAKETERPPESSGPPERTAEFPAGSRKRLRAGTSPRHSAYNSSTGKSESDTKENLSRQAEERPDALQSDERGATRNTEHRQAAEAGNTTTSSNRKRRKEDLPRHGSSSLRSHAGGLEAENALSMTKTKGATKVPNQTLISSFFRKKR
ncbi:conserved hypothetical protein [Neospora caninum Liverpool]|uniref:Ydr279p family (RNase H2 complex component) protein n=1 Tax=Neospora caninum (strain Liverpool) TaxID=572307 RepID=F0VCC6_NEOCL|nr:conserved hypothetical protein [Neospora caninum Liverpool]CBZ51260.1 conserved hypothetical protein [Neospora caninum Liverpool]CEL68575.1 TPA: Ydr279p family (RNase H2 complex component) protein [Neospora caninum Liverpool]|eukprot:XP_003881293.1 conserved hypothetical protein [Neospora caninum Liverpool]